MLNHYLCVVLEIWTKFLESQDGWLVDSDSVSHIEGLMPSIAVADRKRITDLMDSKKIFPLLRTTQHREVLKSRLLQTPGRILSLTTLIQDTLFIERPARALHCLCPPKFKQSLRKVMLTQWNLVGTGGLLEVQTTEHEFTTLQQTEHPFVVSMLQLWLFACRHFVHQGGRVRNFRQQFECSTIDVSLSKLAILASRLGFESDQIRQLRSRNLGQHMAQGFFESLSREEFYKYEERKVQSISNRLQSMLQNLPRYLAEDDSTARFTTNDPELEASHRFNSPARDEYLQQRRNIFYNQIFGPDQPPSEYVTSLGVVKDIIRSFFGKSSFFQPILDERQATPVQSPIRLTETAPGSIDTDMDFEEWHLQVQPVNPSPSEAPQPSINSGPELVEEDTSEPIELANHPSGTPDRDAPPLAAGFEETSQPMETKNYLSVRNKVPEILSTWYRSHQEVIVLYLFESRVYYKFFLGGGFNLRAVLQDLASDHLFMVINEYGIGTPDMNKVYEAALKERLILVGKIDNPSHGNDMEGTISLDKLRDYVLDYDVHTGKRKADSTDNRSRKRHQDTAPDEEL